MPELVPSRFPKPLLWSAWGTSVAMGGWLVAVAALSRGYPFGQDDFRHLTLARQSFSHPELILGVWARPLMTLAYMPASQYGDAAVRATSLALLFSTAVMCWRIAVHLRLSPAPAAAVLLLTQPSAALLGVGALPGTLFSFVLAAALLLRARRQAALAALVASFLPLARLEGLAVLLVWGALLVSERRRRLVPLLAAGMVVWAVAGALVFHDPLHLWHDNYYGVLGSRYGRPGVRYIFVAWPLAFGPIVGSLALLSLLVAREIDRLLLSIALGISAFFWLIWALPAFQSFPTPFYFVSISVPVALLAHYSLDRLVGRRPRVVTWGRGLALAIAAAMAAVAVVPPAHTHVRYAEVAALVLVFLLVLIMAGQDERFRVAATGALLVGACVSGIYYVRPVPLDGEPLAAAEVASYVTSHSLHVSQSTTPAFTWFAREGSDNPGPGFLYWARVAPTGDCIVWDQDWGAGITTEEQLRALRWQATLSRPGPSGGRVDLMCRR